MAMGLLGRRVEPALAGTIITKELVIKRKNSILQHSRYIILHGKADIALAALKVIFFIN
jgi:hypothetical protein